jgi:DNA-binding transcriptional ArsR family regulator
VRDAEKCARICKILSVEARVKILSLLGDKALCVGALAHHLGITQAAVSQHLRILRDSGLVVAEKRGYFVHCRINDEALADWRKTLDEVLSIKNKGSGCCMRDRKGGAS